MQRIPLLRSLLLCTALTLAVGCESEDHGRADAPQRELLEFDESTTQARIDLDLETRAGVGTRGWSLERDQTVDADQADLVLSSWDCGARGRWVMLEGRGVDLCLGNDAGEPDLDGCGPDVQIGGSSPEVELGEVFFVLDADGDARPLQLISRTQTNDDWYLEEDLSFNVQLQDVD